MSGFEQAFLAYILLYRSDADFSPSVQEREYILSKVDSETFGNSLREIQSDNDTQRINKIKGKLEQFKYTQVQFDLLITEMFNLFNIDGKCCNLERNFMLGMKRILKS